MRVWLVTIGEPLPSDGDNERLFRTGILAEHLAGEGHEVVWWTSTFDHVCKRHRYADDQRIDIARGYHLRLLHANRYSKNVSLRRIINHRAVARKFRMLAPREPRPDVIVCSWPTIELCAEAARVGDAWHVPVVLDIRDMWPDAIVDLAPRALRPAARMALWNDYRDARYAVSHATAITSMTDKMVDWALQFANRTRTDLDRAFPMGYREPTVPLEGETEADEFWQAQGITGDRSQFVACFFGAFGRHFEFDTVVEAARRLNQSSRDIHFVLCGDGPSLPRWRQLAADCANVRLPGWVNAPKIRSLMRRSSVGLAPYYSSWDFTIHMPNKPIEYFSAGLPIISSLQGELAKLLTENECGFTYQNGSANDLVRLLADCYDHPTKRTQMGKNAADLYRRCFVAEKVYGQMSDFLAQLAGGKNRRRAA